MNDLSADIAIKQKEIQVENDVTKKAELQKQLQVLQIRKQIEGLRQRIDQIRN